MLIEEKKEEQFLFLAYSIVRSCSDDNALKYIKVYIRKVQRKANWLFKHTTW